jgi:hypothetical protein
MAMTAFSELCREPLTRPELDTLMATAEMAYVNAHAALCRCELASETVFGAAGVAADSLALWHEVLDESIWRLWHGERL